jgi:hypothetical protein
MPKSWWPWRWCLLVLAVGCAADEASSAVTDVVRWFWRHHDSAPVERMADAVVALHGTVTEATADQPLKQIVAPLLAADIAWTGRTNVDPALAPGMWVVTDLGCTLDQALHLHTSPNQAALHPGTYTFFQRTFGQSRDAFLTHAIDRLDWVTQEATPYFAETLKANARWVAQTPHGPALLIRTYMTEPAVPDGGDAMPQFWKMEVFYSRAPGRVVHMSSLWAQMSVSGLTTADSTLQLLQMNTSVDLDKELEAACKSGN